MPGRLILIRHGDAVRQGEEFMRPLAPAAARSLSVTLPRLIKQLDLPQEEDALRVWSDPYVRSRETAALVAQIAGVLGIEVHESLRDEGLGTFGEELIEGYRAGAEAIIVIAREPFLGHAAAEMGGVWLPFSYGGMAVIQLSGGTVATGELTSFHQGPHAEMWETMMTIEALFHERGDGARALLAAFLACPSEASSCLELYESLHSLRALLRFTGTYLRRTEFDRGDRALRKLMRVLARLRRYDVLISTVRRMGKTASENPMTRSLPETGSRGPATERCGPSPHVDITADAIIADLVTVDAGPFSALLEQLLLMREDECTQVVHTLARTQMLRAWNTMDVVLRRVPWRKRIEREGMSALEIRRRYVLVEKGFEARLLATSYEDARATRFLRSQADALCSISKMLRALVGMRAESVGTEACDVQTLLGTLCEAQTSCASLERLAIENLSPQVRRELGQAIEELRAIISRALADLRTARFPVASDDVVGLDALPSAPGDEAEDD